MCGKPPSASVVHGARLFHSSTLSVTTRRSSQIHPSLRAPRAPTREAEVQATESLGMLHALVRSHEEYRWASAFVKHVSLRAGIGGNRGIFGPCIGPRRQDLERFGVARACGPKGVSAQVSVWRPMGIIRYDTAIAATPLHLTNDDDDPENFGEVCPLTPLTYNYDALLPQVWTTASASTI